MTRSGLPLEGAFYPTRNLAPARSVVVFLHGYGASGDDLIDFSAFLSGNLPDTAFYAPHAPEPCELAPFGFQWFSLRTYDPELLRRDPRTLPRALEDLAEGAKLHAGILNDYLSAVMERHGIGPERLAVIGFSQGTMMALETALRREVPVAAVVGFSGGMVGASRLGDEIRCRPPVQLIHGDADDVVPVGAMALTEHALAEAGVDVRGHVCRGLGHGIDMAGMFVARDFLFHRLEAEPS